MIRVTVELVSAIDPSRDKLLGIAHIANVGSGTGDYCTYEVSLSKWAPKEKQTWKSARAALPADQFHDTLLGTVGAFDTVHRGAWDLLYLCLRAVVGSRNT